MGLISVLERVGNLFRSDLMKVQVIMEEDFVKRLDAQARANGLSRSAYINSVMVRHVAQEEARAEAFDKILKGEKK